MRQHIFVQFPGVAFSDNQPNVIRIEKYDRGMP